MAEQLKTQAQSDYWLSQQMMDRANSLQFQLSPQAPVWPAWTPSQPQADPTVPVVPAVPHDQSHGAPCPKRHRPDKGGMVNEILSMSLPDLLASLPSQVPSPARPELVDPDLLPTRDPSVPPVWSASAADFFSGVAHASIVQPGSQSFVDYTTL